MLVHTIRTLKTGTYVELREEKRQAEKLNMEEKSRRREVENSYLLRIGCSLSDCRCGNEREPWRIPVRVADGGICSIIPAVAGAGVGGFAAVGWSQSVGWTQKTHDPYDAPSV